MLKKIIASVCLLAMLVGLLPLIPIQTQAAVELNVSGAYQVGYARVDINPYVVEDDPSSGIMALPLRGEGDVWNRLSEDTLLDDNADGVVDSNDGLKATCIAISDDEGKTVLMITVDLIGGIMVEKVRPAVIERVNAAIAGGELTGVQELTTADVYYAGTHTHNAPDTGAYSDKGKTGTNNDGVDLSVVNENLGIWIDRTVTDICDAAILALEDRAAAQLNKDQLSVSDATSPVLQDKSMVTTRHYNTDVDGVEFVAGDGFNSITASDYANPSDYRTTRGISPKQVTVADDTIYLLQFAFEDSSKLPIILTSWRGHPSLNNRTGYENSSKTAISSDYVNAYRHALEYGCDVTFNTANGYLTDWTLGTTRKYRVAFFTGTSGNVNTRNYEQVTYHGTDGDVSQRGYTWIDGSAKGATVKGCACSFGVVLATLAQECLSDGLNETAVKNGKVQTAQVNYYAARKQTGISQLSYNAAVACQAAMEEGTVTYPYRYTDPDTGEVFLIGGRFHPGAITRSWSKTLGAPITTPVKVELGSILLGQDVAFVSVPAEPFDFYYQDTTLTGDEKFAPENNLWNELINNDTYGKPFVLGYCNGLIGYFPNYEAYIYGEGSTEWTVGSYEAYSTTVEQGTGENMVRVFNRMLTSMSENGGMTYTAACAHCGENQLWEPYDAQTSLTTGHYYLCTDTQTVQIKISGGQTVCIDLKGYTLTGETRAMYTSDTTRDVLNIMDSSEEQTGVIQGHGATYGAGLGFGGGTIIIAADDDLNLYSGTLTCAEQTAYSVVSGGVLRILGTFNMYGGKVTGGIASSFTGSYLSSGAVKTATRTGNGGNISVTGTLNLYGGEISGGKLTAITGTVTQDESGTNFYSQISEEISGSGACVWVSETGIVNLCGNASVEQLHFADGDGLNVIGNYTGSAELKFDTVTELTDMTVVGVALADEAGVAANTTFATVTFTDAPGKFAAVKGSNLIVSDVPYRYGVCEACGECRWQPMTEADLNALGRYNMAPGHYFLTEDVTTPQKQLNYNGDLPGTFCIDLNGHTFTGETRAFYLYNDATLNIFDSLGGGVVTGRASAATGGGVLYIGKGTAINLYGGTVQHGTANSEIIQNAGAVRVNGGAFHMYGGTVVGSDVSTYGGAVYVTAQSGTAGSFTVSGGQITAGTAETAGDCVYVGSGCDVTLSDDADIAEISFAGSSADSLTIENGYTGSVTLRYPETLELTDLTDIGNCTGSDIFNASITLSNAEEKAVAVKDTDLVVSDTACIYGSCEACGDCRWIPITDAQLDAWDKHNMPPGHYVLTENVSTVQKQLNYNGDLPGSFCIDLAGYTFTGASRAFVVYADATLNIFDSVGGGFLKGQMKTGSGGVIYVAAGHVNLYGGTVQQTNVQSDMILSGGTVHVNGGSFNLHGGTVMGFPVSSYGGAVYTTNGAVITADGGQILTGTATTTGDCVYISKGCSVSLSGDADIARLTFADNSADTLTVDGSYTGTVELEYPNTATLEEGTVLGIVSPEGDLQGASVTLRNIPCQIPTAKDGSLFLTALSDRHSYQTETTAPTCTEAGYTTYTCICGNSYTADEVAALGHNYETVTVDVTCTTDGSVTDTCTTCGDKRIEIIPATGHSHEASVTAPTCTEEGFTTYTCHCGDTYTADEVAALGHSYETVTVDVTCTTDGSVTDTCTACGDQRTEIIPATGHSHEAVVTAPTCTEAGYTTYICACGDSYVTDVIAAPGHSYDVTVVAPGCVIPGYTAHTCNRCGYVYYDNIVPAEGHHYEAVVTEPTYTSLGYTTFTCERCGDSYKDQMTKPIGHNYETTLVSSTCTTMGYTLYTCSCGHSYTANEVAALGHSYENGICTICGETDPDYVKPIVLPTLTLKAPTLEFKDMITVNAMFTAENIDDVVEMGMITYTGQVDEWSVETAAHVIPGTTYDVNTDRYIAASQGIHAKYLGDTVYLAVYAKLSDGSYVYSKLAGYSPVQYATSKLSGDDVPLKQLVVAMLNYGAAAQTHFEHNVENLANASLTADQLALPEAYRSDMVSTVASPSADKQGAFVNNQGFAKRYPSISFEGAFCINYFFTPNYTPVDGITLYYWNAADFEAVDVLSIENASGSLRLEGEGTGEYRGDIEGISAKNLSEAVYVAAIYSDGTTEWTSGVLGYSIGAYCAGQSTKGGTIADLAMATAVYGYQAKQYFG